MKKFFVLFCMMLFSSSAFADLSGSVSTTTVAEGESFQLYLRQSGDAEQPDISVLNKDFIIAGQRKSYKTSIINGVQKKYNENILTLIPKKTGQIILPEIYAGKEKTAPLTLTVVAAGQPMPKAAGDEKVVKNRLFLRAKSSINQAYIAQQIPYTVRLFTSPETVLLDGSLMPPQAEGVTVEQWGDPKQMQTVINDEPYNVLEYKFLLFPQKSGKITISAPRFQGLISDPDAQENAMQDMFGFSGAFTGFFGQKNVAVGASEITLNVLPKPDNAMGLDWLPATDLELVEDISPSNLSINLGDAITRTVTVQANGILDSQIPDLAFPDGADYKQYPGKSVSKNLFDKTGIVGVKTRQIVLMPTKAGKIVLPEMKLPWFDVDDGKMKTATLPALSLTVKGAPAAGKIETVKAENLSSKFAEQEASAVAKAPPVVRQEIAQFETKLQEHSPQRVFMAGALAGAAVITLLGMIFFWFVTRKARKLAKVDEQQDNSSRRQIENLLKQACGSDDPVSAGKYLIQLTAAYFPDQPPLTLSDAARKFRDPDVAIQIEILNSVLYGANGKSWNGSDLWNALKQSKMYHKSIEKELPVPPLYPT